MDPHFQDLCDFFAQEEDSSFLKTLATINSDAAPVVSHEPAQAAVPAPVAPPTTVVRREVKPRPAPWFHYKDYSMVVDPNPNVPVTAPGRIPNFPAKMYAILSRQDLKDIVSWMPHGRSWKVHKPREFEVKVIPMYFEHSKFSSFIRQANGWGFRRMISKGPDRNSYYHEMFLRSAPHLMKIMKRPAPSSKPVADAATEPDFYRIAEEKPLPEFKAGGDNKRSFEEDEKNIIAHCNLIDRSAPSHHAGPARKKQRPSAVPYTPVSSYEHPVPAPAASSDIVAIAPRSVDYQHAVTGMPVASNDQVQPVRQCTCNCSASKPVQHHHHHADYHVKAAPIAAHGVEPISIDVEPQEMFSVMEDVFSGFKPSDDSFWLQ